MARVLVTGGAGFIGSRYVHRAVGRGDRVTILDDLSRSGSAGRMQWLREEVHGAALAEELFGIKLLVRAGADRVENSRVCEGGE